MSKIESYIMTGLMLSVLFIMSSCTEKEDFIPEPTPTCVTISGIVTTSSGQPLANIPVFVDYYEAYWLGPQTTIHKAKGTTDINGRYRLFFEPEVDIESEDTKPSRAYLLYADLSELKSEEYIMPGDFADNDEKVYRLDMYGSIDKGDNLEINLYFPKKKEMMTELKNFMSEKRLVVTNTLVYGAQKSVIDRNVELDSKGNGCVIIPCALKETNQLSVRVVNGFSDVCSPKQLIVDDNSESYIIFDNMEVLEKCRFKLSLYSHASFNGEEYGDDAAFSTPAPFDFIGFRIVRPDGAYEMMDMSRYQYYDSIVWSEPDQPETFRVFDKSTYESGSENHFTAQWGSYFFKEGVHKSILSGYRNGKVVFADSIDFELKDRDFLCFDWNRFDGETNSGMAHYIYCRFNSFYEYRVSADKDKNGDKSVNVYVEFHDNWPKDVILNWEQTRLEQLLWEHIGHWIEYDSSDVRELFSRLPTDDEPGKLYENETTRAIVLYSPATEYEEEYYYIHAEPK